MAIPTSAADAFPVTKEMSEDLSAPANGVVEELALEPGLEWTETGVTGVVPATSGVEFPLVNELMEPGMEPALSAQRYIQRMKMDIGTFAQNARVHRNTVARAPAAASVQKHLRENLKVLKAAFDTAGGDLPKAIHWFRNEPLSPFGYMTAEELVASGRTDDVLRLIDSYAGGAAG